MELDMKTRYSNSLSEAYQQIRESAGLADKSKKSGISVGILKKVYDRGLAAYKTGHRPGTTAPQWAMARVNSFITKGSGTWGGADKDLAKQAKGKSEEVEEDFFDPITEACWDGYKQVGMKNKGGKEVPNCVPESVSEWVQVGLDEYYEIGTDEYKEYLKKLTPGEVEEHSNAKPHHHPHREDDDDKKEKGELATTDEARQLKDKKKEMMVKHQKSGVIVIDKKDFKKYQKKGYFAVEEVELDEVGGSAFGGTIDKIQKVADDKQATKIDGVMVDTFTASLIMNIFNKVNKQNQDKMRKMKVTQLAKAAYKLAGVKEEVELDESAASDARRAMKKDPDMKQRAFSKDVSATDDDEKAASKNIIMQMRKAVSLKGRFDVEFQDGKKVKIPAKIAQEVQRKFSSLRRPQEKQKFQAKVAKSHKSMLAALRESFDSSPRKLVEGTWSLPDTPSKKNEFKKLMKSKIKLGKEGDDASDALGGLVGDDSLMDDLYAAGKKNPNGDARPVIKKHMKRLGINEQVELEEGRMKELHSLIQQGKSAKEIAKTMKLDVKTIKALMNSYVPEGKKKPVVFKGTPKQIKQQMKNLKKKDKIKIGEGEEEDRIRDELKRDDERNRDEKIKKITQAKIKDIKDKERNQRNEVLERVASKLKERKNG